MRSAGSLRRMAEALGLGLPDDAQPARMATARRSSFNDEGRADGLRRGDAVSRVASLSDRPLAILQAIVGTAV